MSKEKIALISLGCSKNLVDSENMIGILMDKGYEITPDTKDAEVIIINTCAFIDSAKKESIDTILSAAEYKEGKCKALISTGCLSERYKDEIMAELPELDAVIGVEDFDKIDIAVEEALKGKKAELFGGEASKKEGLPRVLTTPYYTAYLKIAEGCDNFCTYCAIPSIRGRYRSRKMEDILNEAKNLAENGVKELIVIAQDTGRYGLDLYNEKKLPELIRKLAEIEGIKWIRVHYTYPEEIDDELIKVYKECDKLVKYMDIPIQHSEDKVLKRMNRHTTGEKLRALIKKLRDEIPGIAIRTSIIAGFPGETKEEFLSLLSFIKEMKFERLGAFAYSKEENTPAAKLDGQLDEEVKEMRANILMETQMDIAKENGKAKIGELLDILVEGFSDEDLLYYGRSYMDSLDVDAKVYFGTEADVEMGDIVKVKILDYTDYDLTGEMIYE